jgi:hypothetical protein
MKPLSTRALAEAGRTKSQRKMLERGAAALERSAVILDRLESTLERVADDERRLEPRSDGDQQPNDRQTASKVGSVMTKWVSNRII